jgi:hypothetical protein
MVGGWVSLRRVLQERAESCSKPSVQRMMVHIHEGKGGKDRDVMLSPKLLEEITRKPAWLSARPHNDWAGRGIHICR